MTSRTGFVVAFWQKIVLVFVLAYPLGFGPAGWLAARRAIPETAAKCVYSNGRS